MEKNFYLITIFTIASIIMNNCIKAKDYNSITNLTIQNESSKPMNIIFFKKLNTVPIFTITVNSKSTKTINNLQTNKAFDKIGIMIKGKTINEPISLFFDYQKITGPGSKLTLRYKKFKSPHSNDNRYLETFKIYNNNELIAGSGILKSD